jgi:hypothetical protein
MKRQRSNTVLGFLMVALLASQLSLANTVNIGDTREQVDAVLGFPTGWIQAQGFQLLKYKRGKVQLRDGLVVSANIVSEAEASQRARKRAQRVAEARAVRDVAKQERVKNGAAAKARILSDAAFADLDAEKQLRFWVQFKNNYPEVPVDLEYLDALSQAERQRDAQRAAQDRRLVAAHVQRLEDRAEEAERDAEDAERRADRAARRYRTIVSPCYRVPYVSACQSVVTPHVVRRVSVSNGRYNFSHIGQTGHSYRGVSTSPFSIRVPR